VEVWRQRRHPYPEAYALLRLAQARYVAERVRDGEVLREAHETATALGARPLAAEIEAFARRIRVELEPRRKVTAARAQTTGPVTAGPLAHLTPRELEVLALAADGLTNKQIGAKLFISRKTVALHLSNVFAKLDVDNRIQASNIYRAGP
jgi:DNA-binding NarL/FixJ family response regulator